MKKILYFLSFVFVALFTACSEGDDFDIDYTPIAPVGGEYRINVERGYDASKTDAEYWASNPTDAEFIFKTDGTGTLRVFSMPISAILPIMIRIRHGFV